jgi:hypothetical protein
MPIAKGAGRLLTAAKLHSLTASCGIIVQRNNTRQ